ncbi:glyoxalase [Sphingomonas sp. R-74633]|uniref:VOC family protein n=1 Tax=Sphingomonas sp. R-74633 TaxID=2751188 RepID=UPI0015D3CBA0|nr:VOC family protein [Sphingomonas sp. R-74633]NYT40231.1 glyoxalase [Sphingomonas sp. R-74633]
MPNLATTTIRPFVPGGKDFALSKRFYQALGFELTFEAGSIAGFACNSGSFLLQDYFQEGWGGNFMMQLIVEDLDAWWAHIQALDLPGNFGVPAPRAPALMPWGLTLAYVFGPCGELWHVVQA